MRYDEEAIAAEAHDEWVRRLKARGERSYRIATGEELLVPYCQLSSFAKDSRRYTVVEVLEAVERVKKQMRAERPRMTSKELDPPRRTIFNNSLQ